MARYTIDCPVCGRTYETTHEERRQWCSVGCQFGSESPIGRLTSERGDSGRAETESDSRERPALSTTRTDDGAKGEP